MYHNNIEIKEGAFIVSDAHYSQIRPQFLDFLKDIDSKKLKPTQIILMGDIFDALFGEIPYTHKTNQEAINLLNKLSQKIEIIYLEGNHDFNLKNIFPNIRVYSLDVQPILCKYNGKKIMLAHGDFATDIKYNVYTKIIRNTFVLRALKLVDSILSHSILNKLEEYLSKKNDCKEFEHFKEFISKRIENKYDVDYFIEGHYHQNKSINFEKLTYINLGAFACNQRFFIVKSSKEVELLGEIFFSKGI